MDEEELLGNMNSQKSSKLLSSILFARDFVQDNDISTKFADRLYHAIVPLLNHTHYKIRLNAFELLAQLLDEHSDCITCPDVALPDTLISIMSVNKRVAELAYICLQNILSLSEVDQFWPDIENVITNGKSTEERLKVLSLLQEIIERIPLVPIVKLLDDPKAQIRKKAQELLSRANPQDVRYALNVSRISYEAMQNIFKLIPALFDCSDLDPNENTVSNIISNSPVSQARLRATRHRQAADNRTGQKRSSQVQSVASTANSYSAISSRRKKLEDHSRTTMNRSSYSTENPSRVSRGKNSMVTSFVQQVMSQINNDEEESEVFLQSQHSGSGDLSQQSLQFSQSDSHSNSMVESVHSLKPSDLKSVSSRQSIHSTKADVRSQSTALRDAVSNKSRNSRISMNQKIVKNNENDASSVYSNPEYKPIGRIVGPPSLSLPIGLHEIKSATWLERVTFLHVLKEALAMSSQFKETPIEIVDCVLAAADPPHKKVTFTIPPILAELILYNPEILINRLPQIVHFTLFTMVGNLWRENTEFEQFLTVLITESDPTELVNQAIRVSDKSSRPLPCELFVMCVFEERRDLILPSNLVGNLVAQIIKHKIMDPISSELLTFLCATHLKHVQSYGANQTVEIRKILVPYIRAAQSESSKSSPRRKIDVGTDQKLLPRIIREEMKKGSKCFFPRLAAAVINLNDDQNAKLFESFVLFISKVPSSTIEQYQDEMIQICTSKFKSPQYLSLLGGDWIDPRIINGLSKCIWSCPKCILNGSEKYFHTLYKVFKESIGSTRFELAQIFLAIEHHTKHSIIDLEDVVPPYRKLIIELMARFSILPLKE